MTVQSIKTKAESALSELFEAVHERLPGSECIRRQRREAIGEFASLGLPHRRIEDWKFTDLRTLLKDLAVPQPHDPNKAAAAHARYSRAIDAETYIFVDGRFASGPSGRGAAGIEVESLAPALAGGSGHLALDLPETVDVGARSLLALNTALAGDGAVVRIRDGAKPARPVHLVFVSTGTVAVRNTIVAGAGSEATLIETHLSADALGRHENALCALTLGDKCVLAHVCLTEAGHGSAHLANSIARLGKRAAYRPFHLTIGEGLVRHQLTVEFTGEHANLDFAAAALGGANGHFDTTMVVDHKTPRCTSRELYKCVLDGEARGVFQGKVIVRPGAQKTDGKQMAQALMLSPTAEFDSKPELEIYADDVICGHGSTSAEVDEDLLFYCRSRGIPLKEARALLIESFIGEAIGKVADEAIRAMLTRSAKEWLGAGHI